MINILGIGITATFHERIVVSNHRQLDFLLTIFVQANNNDPSHPRITVSFGRGQRVTGGFPSQEASDAESASMSWRLHDASPW